MALGGVHLSTCPREGCKASHLLCPGFGTSLLLPALPHLARASLGMLALREGGGGEVALGQPSPGSAPPPLCGLGTTSWSFIWNVTRVRSNTHKSLHSVPGTQHALAGANILPRFCHPSPILPFSLWCRRAECILIARDNQDSSRWWHIMLPPLPLKPSRISKPDPE